MEEKERRLKEERGRGSEAGTERRYVMFVHWVRSKDSKIYKRAEEVNMMKRKGTIYPPYKKK